MLYCREQQNISQMIVELEMSFCLLEVDGAAQYYVKRRYLVCELHLEGDHQASTLKDADVYHAVHTAICTAHGDYGMALLKQSLNVKYFHIGTRIAILRVKRGCQSLLQAALVFVKKIGSFSASMQTLHISGTIRSCQKFLIGYHKSHLSAYYNQCKTKEERAEIKASIRKCCLTLEKTHVPVTPHANELIEAIDK